MSKLPLSTNSSHDFLQEREMFWYAVIGGGGFLSGSVGVSFLPVQPSPIAVGCGVVGFFVAVIFGVACRSGASVWPFSIWLMKMICKNYQKNRGVSPKSRELDLYENFAIAGAFIWLVGLGVAFEYGIVWGPVLTFLGALLLICGSVCSRFKVGISPISWIFRNNEK